ncbi:porin [Photobacterium indicum]|uniref:Porin n=1 Tax=Photobacterium indicum TaxID=81447 RepID=A0A2T3LBP3_9GAMM|nr:porin [Photobacterium indicum]PSV48757.1 porin [Photobacterium indicum]
MEFKKTILGLAVSSLVLSASVFAADGDGVDSQQLQDSASYEVYGIIALQAAYRDYDYNKNHSDYSSTKNDEMSGTQLNNESRIGFRGSKQFKNFGPKFIWQIEGGYVDPSFGGEGAGLGERDTFVGFESDSLGQVRLGRVLTPIYELIDWPASNPGLGDVYDWGGSIGGAKYQDRQSNTIRWDSPTYAGGLSFDVAVGAGDSASTGSGDDYWGGLAAHYNIGFLQFDAAYEGNRNIESEGQDWGNDTYLLGLQGWFDNGISFFAQYKYMEASTKLGRDEKQDAISTGLMYTTGDWQFKAAYAANFELEVDGKTIKNTDDDVISVQAMYFVDPSAVLYARARTNDFGDQAVGADGKERWKSGSFDELSVGVEYYF